MKGEGRECVTVGCLCQCQLKRELQSHLRIEISQYFSSSIYKYSSYKIKSSNLLSKVQVFQDK